MKIIKFKQDDGLCTVALITDGPFEREHVDLIFDVVEVVFVNLNDEVKE